MNTTISRRALSAVVAACAAVSLAACGSSGSTQSSDASSIRPGPITLCASASLSGAAAVYGDTVKPFFKISEEIVQSQLGGGIAGHKLVIEIRNDQSDAAQAVAIARQFVAEHQANPNHCAAVVLLSYDADTQPLQAAILDKAQIPVMLDASPDAYSDPAKYPYIFPVNPSDKAMGVAAAEYIIGHHISRIGIITNGIPQATEYVNDVESAVKSLGGAVDFVKDVTFSTTATNVTTQLAQLKAADPGAILISAIYGYGPIYTGLDSMGWSPTIIGDVGVPNANPNTLGPLAAKTVAPCWYGIYKGTALPSNIVNVERMYAPMNTIDAGLLIIADAYLEKILLAKYAIEHSHSTEGPAMKAVLEKMTNVSLYWSGMRFTYSPQVHTGLVGAYGVGMCAMTPRAPNDNFYYVK